MLVADLLLDSARQAELTAALSNLGVDNPLDRCLAEAEATVRLYTSGYELAQETLDSWTRSLTLAKAYALVQAVPADLKVSADAVLAELQAIASGKRPGLPRATAGDYAPAGNYGGGTRLLPRTDPDAT